VLGCDPSYHAVAVHRAHAVSLAGARVYVYMCICVYVYMCICVYNIIGEVCRCFISYIIKFLLQVLHSICVYNIIVYNIIGR
jgi:hypothetical protein